MDGLGWDGAEVIDMRCAGQELGHFGVVIGHGGEGCPDLGFIGVDVTHDFEQSAGSLVVVKAKQAISGAEQ
jgi:hypothetical protein